MGVRSLAGRPPSGNRRCLGCRPVFQKWMKTRDAARFLSVSVASLEKWRQRGIGPEFHKLGPRTVRYHADALAEYLAASAVNPRR